MPIPGLVAPVGGLASGPRVSLDALIDIIDVQVLAASDASLSIESDGDITSSTTTLGAQDLGDWIAPRTAAGGNYEVRVTVDSGSLSSGTTGSWLALSSTRTWTASVGGGGGTVGAVMTVAIRHAASGITLASKQITLSASSGA